MPKLIKIKGDASFRTFYRKKNVKRNSIVVFAKKEKFKNLLVYDAINKIFHKNKILAPQLYNENYSKNYIEIQDFGNQTVLQLLKKNKKKRLFYYKKIILLLNKIQKIKTKRIKTFKNTEYRIPNYSKAKLFNEANLFLKWYFPRFVRGKTKSSEKKKISKIFKGLLNRLIYKKKVFIHRDFHISNIMITKQGLGLIDSQDAVYGNIAYDLASLIDDVRFNTSEELKNKIFKMFVKSNSYIDQDKLKNDFDILSVLRNLKIIGIFTRLAVRDKKTRYMKMIPYAWKIIENRTSKNLIFKDLEIKLNKYFSKKLRLKKWR